MFFIVVLVRKLFSENDESGQDQLGNEVRSPDGFGVFHGWFG